MDSVSHLLHSALSLTWTPTLNGPEPLLRWYRLSAAGITFLSCLEKLRNCLWMLAGGETAVTRNSVWTFTLTFLQPTPSCFSSHLASRSRGGRGRVFFPSTAVAQHLPLQKDFPSFPVLMMWLNTEGGNFWVNAGSETYNTVYLNRRQSHFQRGLFAGNFLKSADKSSVSVEVLRLSDMTIPEGFKIHSFFPCKLWAQLFLIMPCLPGASPALSPAICKLNIFWLISIFSHEQLDSILSSEYCWLL